MTQTQFDREFEANLLSANYDLTHKDVVEILDVLGSTIQECLQGEIKEAAKSGWGRKSAPKSRRQRRTPAETDKKVPNPSIIVRGVGKFTVREYPAREGRNPQTGEDLLIPASQRMRVTPHKSLRDRLGVK